ncbi:class C sortase [Enterococcus hulanensis]|uniref:class C sortase n=1 Tax=Enterococcus hulanensis TaxID=2559929 RepID=UPI00288D0D84|nr:class C sortase [Enterococcus hulanensis]MDT2659180.1 class C sortase [Enterococcus hulanensis]
MKTSKNKQKNNSNSVSRMLQRLFFLVAFLFGLSLLLYPLVSQGINDYIDQRMVEKYQREASQKNQAEIKKQQEAMEERDRKARKEKNPGSDGEPFSEEVRKKDEKTKPTPSYVEQHTAGVLVIPKIDVKLPIFDKTNDYFLSKGASLLEGTSSLRGGANSHAVISSHRGLKQAKLFTNLPDLKQKDTFYIEVASETHAYEVDQIKVIEPTDTEDLLIVDGKDYVTLMTCTPYGVNSHRLLVRGHRVPYTKKMDQKKKAVDERKKLKQLLLLAAAILSTLLLIWVIYRIIRAGMIGRRKYTLTFYLLDQATQKPVADQVVHLTGKRGKNAIQIDGEKVMARSDEEGKVSFPAVYGKNYGLKFDQQAAIFACTKVKKINDPSFSLKPKSKKIQIKQADQIYVLGDFVYEELAN